MVNISKDEKRCPYCAEIIKKEAIVCRFCGRDLAATELKKRKGCLLKECLLSFMKGFAFMDVLLFKPQKWSWLTKWYLWRRFHRNK